MAGDEAVYNRQVARIPGRVLLEDPPAGGGAERVRAALVCEQLRRCTDGRATHGKLAHIARNEKRLWISEGNVSLTKILGDGMPIRAKAIVPAWIFRFKPLALCGTYARSGVPPDGASLEPGSQVQGMMKPV